MVANCSITLRYLRVMCRQTTGKNIGKRKNNSKNLVTRGTNSRFAALIASNVTTDCVTDPSENDVGDIRLLDKVDRPLFDQLHTQLWVEKATREDAANLWIHFLHLPEYFPTTQFG